MRGGRGHEGRRMVAPLTSTLPAGDPLSYPRPFKLHKKLGTFHTSTTRTPTCLRIVQTLVPWPIGPCLAHHIPHTRRKDIVDFFGIISRL